nr:copia protein [Tanacetum cinerariifolium]
MGCCLTSLFSKKQTALAISTTEAEYVSVEKACQQALWMKQALVDYNINLDDIPNLCDNKGAINLSKNSVLYSRTKHIEIRHHFLHDNVQKGNISIEKVSSKDNIANILTKPLKREPFNLLRLGTGVETIVYADSDHAGDYVDRKRTSGVCTFMGCCLTSLFSKKQTALAISTTEAEYVSVEKACQQALWMKQALVDYNINLDDIPNLCDNKGAINLSKNSVLYSRTKHIEIRHHFLHDNVQKGNISIEKVSSKDNIANILTKPLKREPFNLLRLGLGLMEPNA